MEYTTEDTCPNCSSDIEMNHSTKPFSCTSFKCDSCGLEMEPAFKYRTLEEVNWDRDEKGLDEVEWLMKQSMELEVLAIDNTLPGNSDSYYIDVPNDMDAGTEWRTLGTFNSKKEVLEAAKKMGAIGQYLNIISHS